MSSDASNESTYSFASHRSSFESSLVDTNEFIEQISYQNYRNNYFLQEQHDNLEQYRELAIKHTELCEKYILALAEISDLKTRLRSEKKKYKQEAKLLRGRIRALKSEQNDKSSYDSRHFSTTSSCSTSCEISFEYKPQASLEIDMDDSGIKQNSLIAEISELKLQLAKAHSEADWKNLQLHRMTFERDALRDKKTHVDTRRKDETNMLKNKIQALQKLTFARTKKASNTKASGKPTTQTSYDRVIEQKKTEHPKRNQFNF